MLLRILDLCGGSGAWSQPYRDAGYDVEIVDPVVDGRDARLLQYRRGRFRGISSASTISRSSRVWGVVCMSRGSKVPRSRPGSVLTVGVMFMVAALSVLTIARVATKRI